MRDKLIEILLEREAVKDANAYDRAESFADFLLAKGVIVPPCKVGSKIYMLVTKRSKVCLPPFTFIKVSRLTFYNLERVIQDFGKTVFLTREEAEQAMKGVQG